MLDSVVKEVRTDRRLMVFDLALGGHHGSYIQHLVDYWCNHDLPGHLEIVVLPEFLQIHRDVVLALEKYQNPTIHLLPILQLESNSLVPRNSGLNRIRRNFQEWKLYQKYACSCQATHSLLMYFDTCELPLTLRLPSPCAFSGIYFRPTFHYPDLTGSSPSPLEQRQQMREKFTLSCILRHPQLKTLFCLDPFVVKHLNQFKSQTEMVPLADPVVIKGCSDAQIKQLRERLGISPNRTVFLVFGALDGRKGISQLLEAIALLPPELCQSFCLLLVGATSQTERALIQPQIAKLSQALPVQIIEHYEFVPETDVPSYFHLVNVVLALYQKHVGMSGILLLAAAAATPVLSSDYGLMGKVVRQHSLGLTIDSTQPESISYGLIQFLRQTPEAFSNPTKMLAFAKSNSAEQYAETIFHHV